MILVLGEREGCNPLWLVQARGEKGQAKRSVNRLAPMRKDLSVSFGELAPPPEAIGGAG